MAGAGQGRAEDYQAVLELYSRLANHRPFLQGEVRHFVREFETKRGDREVENIFGVLERVGGGTWHLTPVTCHLESPWPGV